MENRGGVALIPLNICEKEEYPQLYSISTQQDETVKNVNGETNQIA